LDVFELRNRLVEDYGSYVRSFIRIKDTRIEEEVKESLDEGLLWPDPLIQLNPSFETGDRIDDLVDEGILHEECDTIFRAGKDRGDGTEPFHDPIRTPDRSTSGKGTNPFFVEFYADTAAGMQDLEAREHTAQVPYEVREEREQRFRKGSCEGGLQILYCSPTMELGVDISELNAVNLRNVPPTPANYAQRSGRAGRSGQPALVFAYCSIGSSHDQYFFKRPERMVAGAVSPPRLDLANEDLVRAHVQAVWLTETGQSLGRSLKDVLDVDSEEPSLELRDWVHQSLADAGARRRAHQRAGRVLASVEEELRDAPWYTEGWLDEVLDGVERAFNASCDRWRTPLQGGASPAGDAEQDHRRRFP